MTRCTWAYGLAGLAALLIACGDQPAPRDPTVSPTPTLPTPTARESATLQLAELIPWFREPPGAAGAEAARLLVELWLRDDSLGKAVAALPWVASAPVGEWVPTALSVLTDIADADLELARRVLGYPWLADGALARDELLAIEVLRDIVTADLELGRRAAAFPWLMDGLTGSERYALGALRDVASADLQLAGLLAGLPWFADGVTRDETAALYELGYIAQDICRVSILRQIGEGGKPPDWKKEVLGC